MKFVCKKQVLLLKDNDASAVSDKCICHNRNYSYNLGYNCHNKTEAVYNIILKFCD